MPQSSTQRLIADLTDEPSDDNKLLSSGVGAVVTEHSDYQAVIRQAKDVCDVRKRNLYIFIVIDELTDSLPGNPAWIDEVYEIAHALKAERIKVYSQSLIEELSVHCAQFDIRLLTVEQGDQERKLRFPWQKSLTARLSDSDELPPMFIIRKKERFGVTPEGNQLFIDHYIAGAVLLATGLVGWLVDGRIPAEAQLLLFVLAITFIASRGNNLLAVVASFLGVAIYNFVHVIPRGSLLVSDPKMWMVLLSLLLVSLIITSLSWQLRRLLQDSQTQERRQTAFYNLTRDLLKVNSESDVTSMVERHIQDVIDAEIAVFVEHEGEIKVLKKPPLNMAEAREDERACRLAIENGTEAGLGTQLCPVAFGLYIPFKGSLGTRGCMSVYPSLGRSHFPPERLRILDTFASLLGASIERIMFEQEQMRAHQKVEATSLQNMLLRSVSHDLKTPLTSISGFAAALMDRPESPTDVRVETYQAIHDESWRLTNLINNLLSVTKLESAALELHQETMYVEELVGTAVGQTKNRTKNHKVSVRVADDTPDVHVDPVLMNQALVNLIENAVKYTPHGSTITVAAENRAGSAKLSVFDDGPGIPDEGLEQIFEKFVRFDSGYRVEGTGLGLAIVKSIVELQGGTITASNRPEGGARFDIVLPGR